MSDYEVVDAGDPRKYYTQLPNIIDDMNLSVYAFRLYAHLKRVAGDAGTCWQSVTTLAEACNMSRGMIVKARGELEGKRLIKSIDVDNPKGGRDFKRITIIDIWRLNIEKYASSQDELASSPHEFTSSPGELKNNPVKNNPIKKERGADKPPTPRSDPRTKLPAIQCVKGITSKYPPIELYDLVIAALGETPNGELLLKCRQEWMKRGYNPNSWAWLLEWYPQGIPGTNGNGKSNGRDPLAGIRQYLAEEGMSEE